MAGNRQGVDGGSRKESLGIGVFEQVRHRLSSWQLLFSPLSGEIRRFAGWLELEAFPAVRDAEERSLAIEITPELTARPLSREGGPAGERSDFPHLTDFLRRAGIKRLELDARLEQNQVEDLFIFLYSRRKLLHSKDSTRSPRGIIRNLAGDNGVLLSCMQVRLMDDWLHVSYHYCLTPFSKIILWFEDRNHHFGDHRALFQSAPRYGLIAAIVALVPLAIYLMNGSQTVLLVVSILASLVLFGMVYLFFMVVGSLEYDNEEKAYRLDLANRDLRTYARAIQEDLQRARSIQQKLLPNRKNMPLKGRMRWASAFIPEAAVGGDYFDAIEIDEGKVAVLFADVSGHGMSAAFITAILKATFQGWIEDRGSLEQFIAQLNKRLYDLTPEDSFAAVFAAIHDHANGVMHYFNGGHSPEPILIPSDRSRQSAYLSDGPGMILGVMEDLPVKLGRQRLTPGDRVLLVTDGIIEGENLEGRMYGVKRLKNLLDARRDASIRDLVDAIIRDVDSFTDGAMADDDRTILAFEVQPVEIPSLSSSYTAP